MSRPIGIQSSMLPDRYIAAGRPIKSQSLISAACAESAVNNQCVERPPTIKSCEFGIVFVSRFLSNAAKSPMHNTLMPYNKKERMYWICIIYLQKYQQNLHGNASSRLSCNKFKYKFRHSVFLVPARYHRI